MPVEQVQEILRPQRITSIPLADPMVRGLINLRGRIVTAIDLRSRLALPPLGVQPIVSDDGLLTLDLVATAPTTTD